MLFCSLTHVVVFSRDKKKMKFNLRRALTNCPEECF